MKIMMKDMGVPRKAPQPMPATKEAPKTVIDYPNIRLTSQNVDGLENCKVGQKYQAMFELEVTGDRSPDEWDIREKKMKARDRIVDFKATKGHVEPMNKNSNN